MYASTPLSGEGARRHGGRFNPRGVPALYTSLTIATAVKEADQVGALQPTTLVAYTADIEPLFDATRAKALDEYGISRADLADPAWRTRMLAKEPVPTQDFAARLKRKGFAGLKAPSCARGAHARDLNIVLWVWGDDLPARLKLVDDEGRLSPLTPPHP